MKIFPNYCDTQKFIIRNHNPYGYGALCSLNSDHHTNNLNYPIDLIAAPT